MDGTDCITVFPLVYHQWRVVVIRTIFLLNDKDTRVRGKKSDVSIYEMDARILS